MVGKNLEKIVISQGYLIAEELEDGSPGRPVGNDDGSVALFDDLGLAQRVLSESFADSPESRMSVFKLNVVVAGKVVAI